MTSERSKRRDFLSLIFISKSISKKLLIKITVYVAVICTPGTGSLKGGIRNVLGDRTVGNFKLV